MKSKPSLFLLKNHVTVVQPPVRNSPQDCSNEMFESPTAKNQTPRRASGLLVTRRGFEPRTHCLKGSCSTD